MAGGKKSGAGGALAAAAILLWISGVLVGYGVHRMISGAEGSVVLIGVGTMMSGVATMMLSRLKA